MRAVGRGRPRRLAEELGIEWDLDHPPARDLDAAAAPEPDHTPHPNAPDSGTRPKRDPHKELCLRRSRQPRLLGRDALLGPFRLGCPAAYATPIGTGNGPRRVHGHGTVRSTKDLAAQIRMAAPRLFAGVGRASARSAATDLRAEVRTRPAGPRWQDGRYRVVPLIFHIGVVNGCHLDGTMTPSQW
jgi:hypothetical protein